MKIYAISDTHFGHDKLVEMSGRPENFTELILKNLFNSCGDMLIHCGDFCIGDDEEWHKKFIESTDQYPTRVLVRGNHDGKSDSWYLKHGWDFVCNSTSLRVFGKHILFTHIPVLEAEARLGGANSPYDMNVHGHLHGNNERANRKIELYNHEYHYDLAPEIRDYKPVSVEAICNINKKGPSMS